MTLFVHPDRAENTNDKFTALNKAHEILMDSKRRAIYDETGEVSTEEEAFAYIVSDEDLEKCRQNYAGSDQEKQEIRKALIKGKGNISYVMCMVPFLLDCDRPRVASIADGELSQSLWLRNEEIIIVL